MESRCRTHTPLAGRDTRLIIPRCLAGACLLLGSSLALGQDIYSIHVQRDQAAIVVKGVDLDLATTVTLGGVTVFPTAPVASGEMLIPFATEVYAAVQWQGSYNLVLDGSERLSVYIDAPIEAPPGPPPPPVGGLDCACIPGWQSYASLIADNWAFCQPFQDGNQQGYVASSQTALLPGPTPWLIATAFDYDNPLDFDPSDPGSARSFCALDLNMDGSYEVAEPVNNIDQHDDCVNWLFQELVCM